MKKQLLCGAAVGAVSLALGSPAMAQRTTVVAAVPFTWTGYYFGGHIGWTQARFSGTWFGDSGFTDYTHRPSSFSGGLIFGQNWQTNTFIYGWEVDLTFLGAKKSSIFSGGGSGDTLTTKLDLLSSLRGRLGMTITPATMVYVTGGLGYAHGKVDGVDGITPIGATINAFGGVVGLGSEFAFDRNWIGRIEGLYYIFNDSKTLVGPSDAATAKLSDVLTVRVGLVYRAP